MKVILTETIDSLGIIGKEVNVANGYARNFLLPRKKAVLATDANRKVVERQRVKWEEKNLKERTLAQEMAQRIEGLTITIKAKVGEEDRLYGSVTARDIAKAMAAKGIEIKKSMVLLNEPIKDIGTYSVPIRIYTDIKPEISVEVTPEK